MATWRVAAVQMDCAIGEPDANRAQVCRRLGDAVDRGARLTIFPEAIVPGYCFTSKAEAWPFAETVPGPTTESLHAVCRARNAFAVVGLLERGPAGDLFNTAVLVGPAGLVGAYRKTHLPFLGVDRFTTAGAAPYVVHDLGGLRVGLLICYDGSFPEATRCLMLAGADLVALPTNWPTGAARTAKHVIPARAIENNVYFVAVDRIGVERGVRFIGQSKIVSPFGDLLAAQEDDADATLMADVDPALARAKRLVLIPGEYELDRLAHRRPELYGPLTGRG